MGQPKTGHLALSDTLAVSSRNDYVYVIKTIIECEDPNKGKNTIFASGIHTILEDKRKCEQIRNR